MSGTYDFQAPAPLPRYDHDALIQAFERELDLIWDDLGEHPDAIIAAALNALRHAEINHERS